MSQGKGEGAQASPPPTGPIKRTRTGSQTPGKSLDCTTGQKARWHGALRSRLPVSCFSSSPAWPAAPFSNSWPDSLKHYSLGTGQKAGPTRRSRFQCERSGTPTSQSASSAVAAVTILTVASVAKHRAMCPVLSAPLASPSAPIYL